MERRAEMRLGVDRWWRCLMLALLLPLADGLASAGAVAAEGGPVGPELAAAEARGAVFKVCSGQTYALCAVASCFVLNGVAYCTCEVKQGDSISLPFKYGAGQNVCTVNAGGAGNGFMVSTFSPPPEVVAPRGDLALYTCPAASATGAYAQCDGGICFRSTQGQDFPGAHEQLGPNQIICSCPITVANPATARTGYQIAGPYPCRRSFFRYCDGAVASTRTGATIYVGAPTGTARLLTRLLEGSAPPFNRCDSPASALLP